MYQTRFSYCITPVLIPPKYYVGTVFTILYDSNFIKKQMCEYFTLIVQMYDLNSRTRWTNCFYQSLIIFFYFESWSFQNGVKLLAVQLLFLFYFRSEFSLLIENNRGKIQFIMYKTSSFIFITF